MLNIIKRYHRALNELALLNRWATFVQAHPWRVILATLLFAGATVPGLGLISFNNDYRIYFSPDNEDLLAWEHLLDTYSRADDLLVAVETKNGERIFSPQVMPVIVELTDALWKLPYVTRVDSVANFQHIVTNGDDISIEDLVPKGKATSLSFLQQRERIAFDEPSVRDAMLSKNGTTTGIYLKMMVPKQGNAISNAAAEMREFKARLEKEHPNLGVHLGGLVMLNGAFDYYARSDMMTILPVMFAITIIVMILVFRSVTAMAAAMLAVVVAVITTMGIAGYLEIPIGPHSSIAPQIVKTISVATMIYVVLSFLGQLHSHGRKDLAIRQSVAMNVVPICLSSFTTMVGFLSMLTNDIPPFQHIGIMCAIGTLICCILSLTFLPSLLTVMPTSRATGGAHNQAQWLWPTRLADFIVRRYRAILVAMMLIPIPALVGFAYLEIDDNFVRLFKQGTWFRDDADFIDSHLAGTTPIEFNLHAKKSYGITDPQFLHQVEEIKQRLLSDPMVTHVNVLTDTFKRINKAMHSDDPEYYRIPDTEDVAAQCLLFYEMNLPFGLELNSQINIDRSALRLTAITKSASTKDTIAFVEHTNTWLAQDYPELKARAVSVLVMFSYMAKTVALNAYVSAITAILLVVFVIMVGLRSVRLCLIAILSNIIPIMVVLGLWHWAGRTLDFTAGLIFSITFGVIIDNSLHLMYWYSRGLKSEGKNVAESVRGALERRGPAMLFSTVTLVLGFLVFGLSNFFVNVTLGLLTALVFFVGFVWDILVTPSLLMLLRPHDRAGKAGTISKS